MKEKKYRVRLYELFTNKMVAESDLMTWEEAKKAKEYLNRIFTYSYPLISG